MRKPVTEHKEPYSMFELLDALTNNDLTLTCKDEDGNTVTFVDHAGAMDVLKRFSDRLILIAGEDELTTTQKRTYFKSLYSAWWGRRGEQWGKLLIAFTKDYDPISNYDRREEGAIIDTHAIGARESHDDLTDNYDATKRTTTDTPRVTTTTTTTPDLTETTTETPEVEETVTETPRVATTTTTTPAVVMTTSENIYGDNSSTAVPLKSTTVEPDGVHSDTVTVEPTSGTNTTVTSRTGDNVTELTTVGTETVVQEFDGINTNVVADDEREDTHNRTITSEEAEDSDTRTFDGYRVWGNIGVTTGAQLITGELQLRGAYDLITHALVEFVDLVSVYA